MELEPVLVVALLFIGLPWLVMHYMTKWKTAATITTDDEVLLDELYQLARRLDDRMDTVERLVAADNPDFEMKRLQADQETDNQQLRELDRLLADKKGANR
ncbi:envelope stress response membrane protein PspB [Altererythrobacter lutimaris]|uniref:Envelope stress response membrane protein PspB n=1 Tax=Altererythrobacter lutimaris TaxID=2743979 RepID=A0A850HFV2_9SPHN|nr:envelope stress response membrane protein PspB [Altererythrobacter lutimaris]NVE93412.1 envelope stress response membrane protein PspB [Altererythrobacter lutimaris]